MMKGGCFRWIALVVIWWLTTSTCLLSLSLALPNTSTTASPPAQWNTSEKQYLVLPILYTQTYGCGFYRYGISSSYYFFAVFIFEVECFESNYPPSCKPQVVWSANRNSPVQIKSTLEFKLDGDLVLKGADGTVAWSTNTSGKSVVGMNLTELGNLVLFDDRNRVIWESFDHPTDSLVPGQKLKVGQKLTSSVSPTNLTESGLFSLSMSQHGLLARLETYPPQVYYESSSDSSFIWNPSDVYAMDYVQFLNGSLTFFSSESTEVGRLSMLVTTNVQYMNFSSDGRLRVYELREGRWERMEDVLRNKLGNCDYPTVCGDYGICYPKGQCNCPEPKPINGTVYFNSRDVMQNDLGCSAVTPLTCEAHQYHSFLEVANVTYIGQINHFVATATAVDCKEACASNCSCKAAFFNGSTLYDGQCSFSSQVLSLMYQQTNRKLTTYVKVQNEVPYYPKEDTTRRRASRSKVPVILGVGAAVSSLLGLFGVLVLFIMKKNNINNEVEEAYLDQVPGMPNRFSYDSLKALTEDFSKKLGEGGFGSVFEGSLLDSTKVAVKWLRGLGQIESSFLAEVKTIGSIHHVNLVKLVGFCAEKSHRLLVYEYMVNGSLDGWIFQKKNEFVLSWERRKKVIIDIAKGLNYLHVECREKILHLDIKPQNILLDENFNAKISDFGLAKLIERDQSQVMTMMRGTPGYLAPEWLSSMITEKVDVYSFGVVVLEIVCGRKVFDISQDEDDRYLPSLLKRKAEEGRLINMVGYYDYYVELYGLDAVNMMKLAAWCLQANYTKRPSMSVVVKVLEGVMTVEEEELDYNFWITPTELDRRQNNMIHATPPPLPSVLSAPR